MRKAIIELIIICKLDEEYFGIWDELTLEQQAIFADHATDCDAGGCMGSWCKRCYFCDDAVEELVEEEDNANQGKVTLHPAG